MPDVAALWALYQRTRQMRGDLIPPYAEVRRSIDAAVSALTAPVGDRLAACALLEGRNDSELTLTVVAEERTDHDAFARRLSTWLSTLKWANSVIYASVPDGDTSSRWMLETAGFRAERVFITMQRDHAPLHPSSTPKVIAYDTQREGEVRQLCNLAFADHWGTQPWSAEEWRTEVTEAENFLPEHSFLHLDDDAAVDAFVLVSLGDDAPARTIDIDLLGTRPACRGYGLASHLLERAITSTFKAGFEHVELLVDSSGDRKALRLYQRLGFRELRSENVLVLRPG